jgi:nucleotide-binding universal stress UspA family protein
MATHGRGALLTAVLGSTADQVLRITTHPVLLVGPNCVPTELFGASRLVVPLDGSAASEMIVPVAIDIARQLGLAPWLLQVDVPFDEQMAREMDTVFERVASRFRAAALEPRTKLMFATDPGRSIANFAKTIGASMIAMTTHSGTGVRRLVLGSVAMATVRAARCPVLVLRPDAPERDRSALA